MKFEPELLRFANGEPITTSDQWAARQKELLEILSREVYGTSPDAPPKVDGTILKRIETCCSGHAVLELISISFETERGPYSFPIHLFIPRSDKPTPLFLLLNFRPDIHRIADVPAALATHVKVSFAFGIPRQLQLGLLRFRTDRLGRTNCHAGDIAEKAVAVASRIGNDLVLGSNLIVFCHWLSSLRHINFVFLFGHRLLKYYPICDIISISISGYLRSGFG
ncbi:MAG: hypothetical protein IJN63_03615 [Clostridia bacterium]|nr:hypothetical protein [Clostridia bacterium]